MFVCIQSLFAINVCLQPMSVCNQCLFAINVCLHSMGPTRRWRRWLSHSVPGLLQRCWSKECVNIQKQRQFHFSPLVNIWFSLFSFLLPSWSNQSSFRLFTANPAVKFSLVTSSPTLLLFPLPSFPNYSPHFSVTYICHSRDQSESASRTKHEQRTGT